ncbi:MAG TPA: hypothetical protein VK958_08625 [Methylophilus sp.]|uniref:hypothetical protein n=1 Tax=Methylophilus sp. TaxID=29541 RepID=UPI002C86D5C1|nr:hypothetical protein [Methylophilus sp.]HSH87295.1 hypothetical protein [Methylophilus sp.]
MKSHNPYITLLIITFVLTAFINQTATAKDLSKIDYFVKSCGELVTIYENKNKERFLSFHTTSKSEAFRAGYCRGVIEQYVQQNHHSCRTDWFEIASYISKQASLAHKQHGIDSLLEIGCNE